MAASSRQSLGRSHLGIPRFLSLATAGAMCLALLPLGVDAASRAGAEVGPAARVDETVVVIQHNVQARAVAIDRAIEQALAEDADALTLQEVCGEDLQRILTAHGAAWTIAWHERRDNAGRRCDSATLGEVAIWTRSPGQQVNALDFDPVAQPKVKEQHMGMACVRAAGTPVHRVCSTHLIAYDEDPPIEALQIKNVKRKTLRWIRAGESVVVGGDFNASPRRPAMNRMYAEGPHANGEFREADACACRGGINTMKLGAQQRRRRKIDYIFFSANLTPADTGREIVMTRTASDHLMLRGRMHVRSAS